MMKNIFIFLLTLAACLNVHATGKVVTLSTGATINIFQADATKANGRGVILCPRGGYSYLALPQEGDAWASFYNDLGYTIAVLSYRLPKTNHEVPLADGRAALKYLRDNAKDLNLFPDHIGVMGFSAGGHLASTIATHTEGEEKPAFQILFYPVITMEAEKTHQGSIDNLLGTNPSQELVDQYSNQKHVAEGDPVAYITYSDNDGTVDPLTNGKVYYDALVEKGVAVHLKSFPTGGHGWGLGDKLGATYKEEMQSDFKAWLESLSDVLPKKEIHTEVTSITIEAEATTFEVPSHLWYPNINEVIINSSEVAAKDYSMSNNPGSLYGEGITTWQLAEGIESLGANLFAKSTNAVTIQLPSTLKAIGKQCFFKCSSLTEINLPTSLEALGEGTFSYCAALTKMQIPQGITALPGSLFNGCSKLEEVELPYGIDTIGANTFKFCNSLTKLVVPAWYPPKADATFIQATQKAKVTLYVPAGRKAKYEANEQWQGFAVIEELPAVTGIKQTTRSTEGTTEIYSIAGLRATPSTKGIIIQGGKKIAVK